MGDFLKVFKYHVITVVFAVRGRVLPRYEKVVHQCRYRIESPFTQQTCLCGSWSLRSGHPTRLIVVKDVMQTLGTMFFAVVGERRRRPGRVSAKFVSF